MKVIITEHAAKCFNKLDKKAHQKLGHALRKLYDFPRLLT